MRDTDRFRLLGEYTTPLFEYGEVVFCEWRGDVKIVSLTDAKIPWQVGMRASNKSLVIFGSLVDALRRVSNQAICHWWGITPQTVSKWRKSLGIPVVTERTRRLFSENAHAEPNAEALKRCHAKAREPEHLERLRKLAESRKGQPRPKRIVEIVRVALTGRKLSPEHCAKIGKRNKRMGIIPRKAQGRLWTRAEDELVRTPPATGRRRENQQDNTGGVHANRQTGHAGRR